MRTDKQSWRGCLLAAVLMAAVVSAGADAQTIQADKAGPQAGKVHPLFHQIPQYLPDEVAPGDDMVDEGGLRGGFPFDCYELADTGDDSFRDSRFLLGNRINLYAPRTLQRIKPVLNIADGDVVEIAFVVYKKELGDAFWTKLAQVNSTFTGDGTTKFYSSSELSVELDPGAIDPNPDRTFLVGFAWVDEDVRFWQRTQGSDPFEFDPEVGEVFGSVVESITSLTLLETWVMTNRFNRFAMDICFDPLPGACCSAGVCLEALTRSQCQELDGQYTAGGVTCAQIAECPLPTGACCFIGTGEPCFDLNVYACAEQDGEFMGLTSSCAIEACNPRGACCIFGGECQFLSEAECAELDLYGLNVWTSDTTCDDVSCNPIGACCSITGDACDETVIESECNASGGIWTGPGVPCEPSPCALWHRGGCCMFSGICEPNMSPYECEVVNRGTYLGDDITCGELPCFELRACCRQRACFELIEDDCDAIGGTWSDTEGERCDGNPCNGPVRACCLDGECELINQADCEINPGATWFSDVESCEPNPCDAVGACCEGATGCTLTTEIDCTGNYLGDDTTCYQCSLGACCPFVGDCFLSRRDDCTGLDEYQGEFTICDYNRCGDCDAYPGSGLGDFDGDGRTTLADYPPFATCLESVIPSEECRCAFDFDVNGIIDLNDFGSFQIVFETE